MTSVHLKFCSVYRKLTVTTFWANSANDKFKIFFLFLRENRFWHFMETICLKCQNLFSGKTKKNIWKCHLLNFLPRLLSVKDIYGSWQNHPHSVNKGTSPTPPTHIQITSNPIVLRQAWVNETKEYVFIWPSLNEPHYQKILLRTCAPSEDSDQTAHPRSLIRIFSGRFWESQGRKVYSCWQRKLRSDWAEAQDLSLRWAQMLEGTFTRCSSNAYTCHICELLKLTPLCYYIIWL